MRDIAGSRVRRESMRILAGAIDERFNGNKKGKDRRVCFVLLTAPFGNGGRLDYMSNGERNAVVTMMKGLIARLEGHPEMTGEA
jgi:hypothetical protein